MNKFWHDIKIIVTVFFLMVSSVAVTLWIVREVNVFSPPELGPAGSQSIGPAQFMSTIDLQRELNRRYPALKLKEDGKYGPRTREAHEKAIGDQYAKEFWPDDTK